MPAFVHANRSIDGKGSTHAPNNAVWIPMGSTLFQTPAMRQPFYASLSRRYRGAPPKRRAARASTASLVIAPRIKSSSATAL